MKLVLDSQTTITQVQREFATVFPFLKLEFFSKAHKKGFSSMARDMVRPGKKRLGDFRKIEKDGHVKIDPFMTVAQLEQILREEFGLYAQVFRKSGDTWLETTLSDDWSLQEQNQLGIEKSDPDWIRPNKDQLIM